MLAVWLQLYGILLLFSGVVEILLGKEREWEFARWWWRLLNLENQRESVWEAKRYFGTILSLIIGGVLVWIQIAIR